MSDIYSMRQDLDKKQILPSSQDNKVKALNMHIFLRSTIIVISSGYFISIVYFLCEKAFYNNMNTLL